MHERKRSTFLACLHLAAYLRIHDSCVSCFVSCQNNLCAVFTLKYVSALYIQVHTHTKTNRTYFYIGVFLLKLDNDPKPLPLPLWLPHTEPYSATLKCHTAEFCSLSQKRSRVLISLLYTATHSPELDNRILHILFKIQ